MFDEKRDQLPGAYVVKNHLFFRLRDNSVVSCDCIGEPCASQIVELFTAPAEIASMMTDAEDLLLEIANSMLKDFVDPAEHVNWCVEEAQKYFVEKGNSATARPFLSEIEIAAMCGGRKAGKRVRKLR